MKIHKNVIVVVSAVLFFVASAHSGEAEDKIFNLTNGIKSRYLADSGDLKLLSLDLESKVGELFGSSSKCTKRRAGDLSRAYRGVLEATTTADARKIFEAAKKLDHNANNRSKMFTKCWKHMKKRASALGEVGGIAAQVVATGNSAGWK